MKIKSYKIHVGTNGFCDIKDLTPEVREKIDHSGIREGQATVFVVGSTAGLTTVEYEPGLVRDLQELFEEIAPQGKDYHHEKTWHDGNGFSHVRASLLKPSLTVPVVDGQMTLGTWQQIILIDFDNTSRNREIVLQVMGE
ncbi:MAG: secondary thiamine-phosphate synthase enzyme YjbQ [Candidatus Omnitrophica bacterium]|nr:secondary thiamine-phosphate synthase enzyme YjbQ [Candidatus Omnitrophota bacterium]